MAAKYCKSCLRKAKGKVGPLCPCGNEWTVCKNTRSRAATVTRLRNKRNGVKASTRSRYQDYLGSEVWKSIRQKILDRDGYRCRICGKRTCVVHHRNYDSATMSGDSLDSLISLCRGCHKSVHRDEHGKRHGILETERKLVKLLSHECNAERSALVPRTV